MSSKLYKNMKLGFFVSTGMALLILLLYFIGKNRNLFGSNFVLKARFENVQGLKDGNNVRYAGIDVGSVSKIKFINDTVVEVFMNIENKMKKIIRKNALVSIGTDGLVGNKVVNISSIRKQSPLVQENDVLITRKPIDTDDMLRTLFKTNNDIAIIAENLKQTIMQINESTALWNFLKDDFVPKKLHSFVFNLDVASKKTNLILDDAKIAIDKITNGSGTISTLLYDTVLSNDLRNIVKNINNAGSQADELARKINILTNKIDADINQGYGPIHALLKDSTIVHSINRSMNNIEKATDRFNIYMEALKHNFLFRGYFKKIEKNK